jgi:hypothetical protein
MGDDAGGVTGRELAEKEPLQLGGARVMGS